MSDSQLLIAVVSGISLLLFLILYLKIQAFMALLLASITVGALAGMPAVKILESVQTGMAGTLGFISVVVGLGAIFGAILEQSGGVQALASFILRKSGRKRAHWALMVTGFFVSIPVFFDVAFIILVPVVYALQQKTGKSLLLFGLSLLAGLAVSHSFIPPTPGPVAVAEILGADLGDVILMGALAGIPAAIVAGPLFGSFISRRIFVPAPAYSEPDTRTDLSPSAGLIAGLVALPLCLILLNTFCNSGLFPVSLSVKNTMAFIGHPFIALLIANLFAWYLLGIRRGFSRQDLLDMSGKSLAPAGMIILITGAGGVFKQMLSDTGAGQMVAGYINGLGGSLFFFAFVVAALVRVLQGSATVAMITAAGMTAALLDSSAYNDMDKALLVIAIASGATILSHVNDSGFWLVSKYFGITEKQTLRSWTIMTTIIALMGFMAVLLIHWTLALV